MFREDLAWDFSIDLWAGNVRSLTYDSNGNVTQEIYYSYHFGMWAEIFKKNTTYNRFNQITRYQYHEWNSEKNE